ncbi:MAG: hypothetical protein NXI00_14725 [Cytophagales bacterium]|nr:hypothetical protein [Cytophagales bacterium]
MVILENIIILALFGGALGYVLKKVFSVFFKKNGDASGACASCSAGSCGSVKDFEAISHPN